MSFHLTRRSRSNAASCTRFGAPYHKGSFVQWYGSHAEPAWRKWTVGSSGDFPPRATRWRFLEAARYYRQFLTDLARSAAILEGILLRVTPRLNCAKRLR